MTTKVTITGSGYPAPSATRAGPGVLIEANGFALQFDAGRSTVLRLTSAGIAMADLDAVFVTHHHSDHLTGLADIVLTRWVVDTDDGVPALRIVCPAGPAEVFLQRMLDPWEHDLAVRSRHSGRPTRPRIEMVAFECADGPTLVWQEGEVTVRAAEVRHEPVSPAVGYRIETPDGVVAISGDTLVCDEVAGLAAGAQVLVHEAMLFEVIAQRPPANHFIMDYHADSRLLGRQAHELGVETLILVHLVPEPTSAEVRKAYVDNVRAGGFAGDLLIADDLDVVVLGRGD
ncbi:MAG TPA: MBL fold metallo-hydrolase [Acidimicrobiia bacterium]|jgi:ribonuclease Z|nr:MBL fold metallo-hydrolase [Acidimicrobiia bacterium]